MPRLGHAKVVAADAMEALVNVYIEAPAFVRELREIRRRHRDAIWRVAELTDDMWRETLSSSQPLSELRGSYASKNPCECDLSKCKDLPHMEEILGYVRALGELAHRWKLRTPMALTVLIAKDIAWVLGRQEMPHDVDLPLECYDRAYPWRAPLPPLEIKVSAWAMVHLGRRGIQRKIARTLEEYEGKIKKTGLGEYPEALKRHARWWFQYHVEGKPYDEIAQHECYYGPSIISYAKNVGAAVRRFSRIVGVDPATLK